MAGTIANDMPLRSILSKALGILNIMPSTPGSSILDLPNELIVLIIEHVEGRKTLERLARTCHRMQSLAEPALYRSLLLRSQLMTACIQKALECRPERAQALHVLDVPCDAQSPPTFTMLAGIMRSARNLNDLMFESPACNTGSFEDGGAWDMMMEPLFRLFREASLSTSRDGLIAPPLQRLQKLTIHTNGAESPYWNVDARSIHIFLHPTLRELKLSCVNIDLIPTEGYAHVTPLRQLTLEECNVTCEGLSRLLSLPVALQTLSLGENCHNVIYFPWSSFPVLSSHLFERDPHSAVQALKQQKHSLQSLTYITAPMFAGLAELFNSSHVATTALDAGFAEFYALERVELRGYCPIFERAVMSVQAPPNLRHLAFKAKKMYRKAQSASQSPDASVAMSGIPFLRAPSASPPASLKCLDITYVADNGLMVVDIITPGSRERSFIRDAGIALGKMGVELRVSATRVEGDKYYFPPYLYGESAPIEDPVFVKGEFVGIYKASERRLSRIARTLIGPARNWEGV